MSLVSGLEIDSFEALRRQLSGVQATCVFAPPRFSRAFVFVDVWFMCVCVCAYVHRNIQTLLHVCVCACVCVCVCVCVCLCACVCVCVLCVCVRGQGREAEMRSSLQALIADLRQHLLRYSARKKLFARVVSNHRIEACEEKGREMLRAIVCGGVVWVCVLHAVSPPNSRPGLCFVIHSEP